MYLRNSLPLGFAVSLVILGMLLFVFAPLQTEAITYQQTLRQNSPNTQAVAELQQGLRELDIYFGSVDGKFGPATKRAVEGFQAREGLKVDGIAGRDTINRIDSYDEKVRTYQVNPVNNLNAKQWEDLCDDGQPHIQVLTPDGGEAYNLVAGFEVRWGQCNIADSEWNTFVNLVDSVDPGSLMVAGEHPDGNRVVTETSTGGAVFIKFEGHELVQVLKDWSKGKRYRVEVMAQETNTIVFDNMPNADELRSTTPVARRIFDRSDNLFTINPTGQSSTSALSESGSCDNLHKASVTFTGFPESEFVKAGSGNVRLGQIRIDALCDILLSGIGLSQYSATGVDNLSKVELLQFDNNTEIWMVAGNTNPIVDKEMSFQEWAEPVSLGVGEHVIFDIAADIGDNASGAVGLQLLGVAAIEPETFEAIPMSKINVQNSLTNVMPIF